MTTLTIEQIDAALADLIASDCDVFSEMWANKIYANLPSIRAALELSRKVLALYAVGAKLVGPELSDKAWQAFNDATRQPGRRGYIAWKEMHAAAYDLLATDAQNSKNLSDGDL